jgi:hypothetical protein
MSGNLLHVNATVTCPHGGKASVLPAQQRVLAGGQPVSTVADMWTIVGCLFTVGNKPQPCVTIDWSAPSQRVRAGAGALTQLSGGICVSAEQIRQGPAFVTVVQQRAVAL